MITTKYALIASEAIGRATNAYGIHGDFETIGAAMNKLSEERLEASLELSDFNNATTPEFRRKKVERLRDELIDEMTVCIRAIHACDAYLEKN